MRSSEGSTTVTEVGTSRPRNEVPGLRLVWVFPSPGEPIVRLAGPAGSEVVLGRDESSGVRLSGEGVSRRHAVLRFDAEGVVSLSDLGSRNGTHIDGRPIDSAWLRPGMVVRLGGWVGVVTAHPGELREIAAGLFGGARLEEALAPLRRVAPSDLPIVIEGETGTGKELVAHAVHAWSGRTGPFVAVNCAALPEALAEGELFGYRRGAFTGAERASPGLLRSAAGGTLLLDEVSDLSPAVQAKLLRAIEQREVQPLGETRPLAIDVRLVVAGQESLLRAVQKGHFRADLLARLEGLTLLLPPLRERREDVLPLFSRFLRDEGAGRAPALDADFVERLLVHDWPFNVRELGLLARRLVVLHGSDATLGVEQLPDRMLEPSEAPTPAEAARPTPTKPLTPPEPVELPALVTALRTAGGNVARAAAMLGITRQRAYRLMEGHAVNLDALRAKEGRDP